MACAQHLSLLRHPEDPIARNTAETPLGHWLQEAECLQTDGISPLQSRGPLTGAKGELPHGSTLQLLAQP